MKIPRAPKREIFGWAMFDFANQAYILLIITVVFSVVFPSLIVGDGPDYRLGNFLWSVSIASASLLTVVVAPMIGALTDYSATRKLFLFFSYLATVIASASLYFVTPGWVVLGMFLIIASNLAYSVGEILIASFLPDLGPPETLGKISGIGWSVGYLGGMVATVAALIFIGEVSAENFDRLRAVGPLAGAFFLFGAIPTFMFLRERGTAQVKPAGVSFARIGFERLAGTVKGVRQYQDLMMFLATIFFAMCGISIIISFTFIYGDQVIKWDSAHRTKMFVITQITAAVGAVTFGYLQDYLGAKKVFSMTLIVWIVAILLIYFTPAITALLNQGLASEAHWHPQQFFLFVGCVAGIGLGSLQSAGRTIVGLFAPKGRAAEFFGFWGLSNKLAAVFGILGIGVLQILIGLHLSILICLVFFSVSLALSFFIDVERGKRAARSGQI